MGDCCNGVSVHSWIHGASCQVIGCVICSSVMLFGILLSLVVGNVTIWRYMRSTIDLVIPCASIIARQMGSHTNMWCRLRYPSPQANGFQCLAS